MGRIIQGLTGAVKLKSTFIYNITDAPVAQPVDTLITNAQMLLYDELSFTLIMVSAGGQRYALVSTIKTINTNNPSFADLKFTRSVELLDQIGDVTLSIWLDGTSGTVQYQYDVDGSGITFESATMLGYNYYV